MGKTIHMCHSIRGPLKNWTKREWKQATKYMTKPDGSRFTVDGLKDLFLSMLAEGKEVFPLGECDNFDWKTGCRGHETKE